MGRLSEAILQSGTAYSTGKNAPMVDIQFGGQMGFAPDLAAWVSNQQYVRRNLFCLLIEAPKGFQLLPNPDSWIAALRALVELHPISIDGLNASLEVEFSQTPVGGGGQQQDDFTDVKETQSNITFRWNEKYGMPVANFLRGWITNLMMDPNSKVANIATLSGDKPVDMLSDMTAATMLFIEPDPTFTKVQKAWLVTNMMPKGTGDITGRRDQTQANETVTYDVPFTGIAQFSLGVDAFAQSLLSNISLTGANPQLRPAFVQQLDPAISTATQNFASQVSYFGSSAVDTSTAAGIAASGAKPTT